MRRGELYRVRRPSKTDPRTSRVFVVVGREAVIQSRFSTVICAPVYSSYHELRSQVLVGIEEGLKHESSIHCDELVSVPKAALTDYVGSLSSGKLSELNAALLVALGFVLDDIN
ncbi:MAG: type II toxin-antitoxin system PemK/MazF family toxin [Thermoanaerobaculia bacterium]